MGNEIKHGQKTIKSGEKAARKKEKRMARTDAIAGGKNRKKLTGRDHQGNHDSATKQTKRHDDRHQHGIAVAGAAGSKK
jgi:hypothetical protein